MFKRLKQFLKKLARTNQEEFKGTAPDCCTINRPEPRPKAEENTTKKQEH
ncbi:MAG: hypothetical protein DDT21_00522 [Syntrophomonadaceae bacterium]|nr:hypothetical protein [Bacillota bacterium]